VTTRRSFAQPPNMGPRYPVSGEKKRMQFGLNGFYKKHVIICVNSKKVMDEAVLDHLAFFFYDIPSRVEITIILDERYRQSNAFVIDGRVKGFKITSGRPINIEPVEYGQGLD
jgi:hypothetical protein